ncbi:carboxypeptidase regulatory-like domain-containing protein [Silvibacterium acidisoli]|uniref:carboxypeptidase regulatory-like domain-containing protein n=1 Tax=Acidobacteriaceae bacterium ZG23-2 TaxID=2883246 RepID=UPI00406D0448
MKQTAKIFALLLVVFYGSWAFAQFLSGIQGTVQDQTGAAVAGATVTITDTRTNITKSITTNESGFFRFDSIGASTYVVHVTASGFTSWDQKDLVLGPGETRTITPALNVGSTSTSVTVQAAAVQLDLVTPTTSSVVSSKTVENTPLPGQNVYSLATLTPGMTGSAVTSGDNYTNEYAININAAGLRQEENGYQIDGAYTNTPSRGGGSSISPNPAIVESMDIRTNDFDAAKGRNGGATIDIFTKSGSNDFHGSIDYYFLNNNLSAHTEFNNTVPTFTRNEIGATFGGPIIKNKFFIFGAVDVLRSSTTNASTYQVETPDFTNWAKTNLPNNIATQILTTAPPLSNPTSGIQTVAQVLAANSGITTPPANLPLTLPALGTANIAYSVPKDGYQWSVRGDYYIRQNDRLYVTGIRTYVTSQGATPRPALNDDEKNSSDFVNVDYTHTFSPRLLNEAGANIIRPYGSDLAAPTMNIPYVNVTGLQNFNNWGPGNFTQQTMGWRDMMQTTFKNHSLKFGFEQFNIRENALQTGAFTRPTYNFNNLIDFVQDAALTESGTPVDLNTHQQAPYTRRYRTLYTGAFVQDSWKIAPTFTFNAGLRYDVMADFFAINQPRLTNFTLGSGDFNTAVATGTTGYTPSPHVLDHNIWGLGPRIGFSWDIFGTGKTALRGGVGMFNDQPPYLHITDITAGNLPNYYTPSLDRRQGTIPNFQLCSAPTGFTEVCPIVDTSNITLNSSGGAVLTNPDGSQTIQRASLGAFSPDYKLTRVEAWTLSVQQELPYNMVFELNYSGTAARHLPIFNQDINRFSGDLVVNKGSLQRLNPNFNTIQYAYSNGNSFGSVGSATLARRFTHGVAFRGIYTWSKALDYLSTAGSLDGGNVTGNFNGGNSDVIVNNDLKAQRGRADFDIRQQFTADGTWTTPNSYSSRWERGVFGDWQFGGVWIVQSGLPFTVYTSAAFSPVYNVTVNNTTPPCSQIPGCQVIGNSGGDYNADGSNFDLPNVPKFGRHLQGQSRKAFINGIFSASDFPTPALGQEGNLGRNTYDGPGYNNVDFTFERFFHTPWFFGEKMQIEAKGEVTNLFNRANLLGMNSDLSSGLFGKSNNQYPARYLQLHIRATF